MILENLGINPVLILLQAGVLVGLPILSWIVLYARGAATRDLLFWGVIALALPLVGPLSAIVFALRLKRERLAKTS